MQLYLILSMCILGGNAFLFSACPNCPVYMCPPPCFPPQDSRCPLPADMFDEVYIIFEKWLIPMIEVLLNTSISKISTSPTFYYEYINTIPRTCRLDKEAALRSETLMKRMEYLRDVMLQSPIYQRGLILHHSFRPLSTELERLMRLAMKISLKKDGQSDDDHFQACLNLRKEQVIELERERARYNLPLPTPLPING